MGRPLTGRKRFGDNVTAKGKAHLAHRLIGGNGFPAGVRHGPQRCGNRPVIGEGDMGVAHTGKHRPGIVAVNVALPGGDSVGGVGDIGRFRAAAK